jgi:hypothetical protein
MITSVALDLEGFVLIADTIHDAKILGVDHENNFLVLLYGKTAYHVARVDAVFYNKDDAQTALASRES